MRKFSNFTLQRRCFSNFKLQRKYLSNFTRLYSNHEAPLHKNAELYDSASGLNKSILRQSLTKYSARIGLTLPELKIKGRILDVGCGQGNITKCLTQFLDPQAKVDAFDMSKDIIEYAKKYHSRDNINFFAMNATDAVPDDMLNSYDFVISHIVFQWAQQHEKLLQNIISMMKDGANCLIVFYRYCPIYSAFIDVSKMSKWSLYMKNIRKITPRYHDFANADVHFGSVMKKCGFKNVNVESVDVEFGYRDLNYGLDTFRNLFQSIDPFYLNIPTNQKEQYIDDIMKSVVKVGGFRNYNSSQSNVPDCLDMNATLLIATGNK